MEVLIPFNYLFAIKIKIFCIEKSLKAQEVTAKNAQEQMAKLEMGEYSSS